MPEGAREAIGDRIGARLAEIRRRHREATTPEAVADIVVEVLATMHGDLSGPQATLLAEVEQIGRTIAAAKREIAALRVEDIKIAFIPSATDELDAIVEATAKATHEILDSCETLEAVHAGLNGPDAEAAQAAVTRIYEACSFQDITGQRITKVVRTLKSIEERIERIVSTFSDGVPLRDAAPTAVEPEPPTSPASLLNGPQLPGHGVDQAEIDRLLASFD
ncbi:MAG: protein phosphatase CheZ [Acetobacteraceae bacterium]|nr:protein phosphatase CheZ [Acetobacteraceae bacterium]